MALVNTHLGRPVPWHFDSRFFTYKGKEWRIIAAEGPYNDLQNTVYTIRDLSDGKDYDIVHRELVKKLLEERKRIKEQQINTTTDNAPKDTQHMGGVHNELLFTPNQT